MARNERGVQGDIESSHQRPLPSTPSTPSSTTTTPHPPPPTSQPDPLLYVCKGFSLITSLVATLCLVVNAISAIKSFKNGSSDIFNGIFRCYAVALAIFVAVAETEWGFIFQFWRVSFAFFNS
ncbi:hypothetical protein IFM89_021093 [Coptis chinensis]|uniref:Uncharacterized protein n=1 Tax=Coptis chinensis TaxID=261450 RepID=A0A835LQY6_9MAGN|nr:hypothetical protein IFM89_021093 [Coptis chinensis]